jgi:chaperone modulatory protein CbpM
MTDPQPPGSGPQVEIVSGQRTYTLHEACLVCGVGSTLLVELVEYGITLPQEPGARDWTFSDRALLRAQKALRLRRDLGLELAGLALALDLLDEIERLRREVARLRTGTRA